MDTGVLKQLGLTQREVEVYIKLLELEDISASQLAKKLSVSRTHVYDTLETLIHKGLVSYITNNQKRLFRAVDPDHLLTLNADTSTRLNDLVPKLAKLRRTKQHHTDVQIYEGHEGMKTIISDVFKLKDETMLIINASEHFLSTLGSFAEFFIKEKKKQNLKTKMIFAKKLKPLDPDSEARYIERSEPSRVTTVIYGNKVAIVFWLEPFFGLVIDSDQAAKEYRTFFKVLWKKAKPV